MDILIDKGDAPFATLLFAHGAGAPMDAPVMNRCTEALCQAGFRVARFEFAYMAARRAGQRKPAPKAETLMDEYRAAADALDIPGPLIIGGKSMGGRVASMVADGLHADGKVAGLFCLGYPFHPPTKPEQLRTAHLRALRTPTLVCQGTRDPFGMREEVAGYDLSASIEIRWFEDGDHDLKPRKSVSGFTHADHLAGMSEAAAAWARRIIAR
jgi:predicted alpha/beta-hydrolase family hydrolase